MKITILLTSDEHPTRSFINKWVTDNGNKHEISIVNSKSELDCGDILFLISCNEIIKSDTRKSFRHTLVVHASKLPEGRGWSPYAWAILEGKRTLTLSLLEADDKVDSGSLWHQIDIEVARHMLYDEINELISVGTLQLMDFAVANSRTVVPWPQNHDVASTYYRKRIPSDHELDPSKGIAEQFNLLRISDPKRFPAFFYLYGEKYKVTLEKLDDT